MIILDTNVISEPMKPNSNPAVIAWLDRQLAETLYLTATSFSELLVGIEILPDGKRKQELSSIESANDKAFWFTYPAIRSASRYNIRTFDRSCQV